MAKLFGIDLEPDFSMAREERSGHLRYFIWIGFFAVLVYAFFDAFDVRLFQAYLATVVCYGLTFYVRRGDYFRKLCLWKAILTSLPIHVLYVAAIFWADKASPQGMTKPVVFIPALTLGGAIESIVFDAIADRFKPLNIKAERESLAD